MADTVGVLCVTQQTLAVSVSHQKQAVSAVSHSRCKLCLLWDTVDTVCDCCLTSNDRLCLAVTRQTQPVSAVSTADAGCGFRLGPACTNRDSKLN